MKKNHVTQIICLLEGIRYTKKQPYHKSDAVKLLEMLSFAEKRKKYPNIPIDYLTPVTFRDDTANSLTKCSISYIQLNGGQAERISTTGRPIDRTKIVTDVLGHQRSIWFYTMDTGNNHQ